MHSTELVCERDGCGYNVAVGNGSHSAFQRCTPGECPQCGADLTTPA